MTPDPNFINPLNNPIFIPIVERFIIVCVVGFLLILILNKFKIKNIWQTNLGKRYISWLAIGVLYVIAVFFGGYPSLIFLLLLMLFAINECAKISQLAKIYTRSLYLLAIFTVYLTSFHPDKIYTLPLLYFIVLSTIAIYDNRKNGLFDFILSIFISIWIIFALAHFILLGHLNNDIDSTKSLLIFAGIAVAFADIGAYVLGKSLSNTIFAKRKIASNISPKKAYTGMFGSIIGASLAIAIMYFTISKYFTITQLIILAILIGFMAVIGDLTESLFKRYFNKKDSSKSIPGHGGILDRIDSILRVILVIYYFSLFILVP